eukprot:CAMPEP_0118954396 /NCGR_PEP_ID=MMETSP1169-20130426/58179_1 /TAXON_ID=36882 /ORGANISM="Pyramimonas obovata, Strain CCMP722" /LENGTH=125 /DNA_ID=CAMNT_0006902023 /DNA_START=30 /DNA_END=404 /DNA_ORIENTATION=+
MELEDNQVEVVKQALRAAEEGGAPWVVEHVDVTCDSCEIEPILGSRWKCSVCEDRDLCAECFSGLDAARDRASLYPEEVLTAVPCLKHKFERVEGPERQVVLRVQGEAARVDALVLPFLETFRVS